MVTFESQLRHILSTDPYLSAFVDDLKRRLFRVHKTEEMLTGVNLTLSDFASGHEFFGLHKTDTGWVFREWAPNATAIFFIGDFSSWEENARFSLKRISFDGTWEITLPEDLLHHGDLYRLKVHWTGGYGDRLPIYVRRVHQDPETLIFNAEVWEPSHPYQWQHSSPRITDAPFVYEAHVGMAQDKPGIGTYLEFTTNVLPRIINAGYNTLQLMAIQQHPYYGSFGYHVSNFFAASSRFGTPEDLKTLIDTAHGHGLRVLIDIVHSHAVSNEVEGLGRFDGTVYQFFHDGPRGYHHAWDSRCFNYKKPEVLHFLLSNCRYWLDEYHIDGFRFDGITSMLYTHHGLSKAFTSYSDYFCKEVDEDALTYLTLANKLIHTLKPDAITIAEDVSGMPCLAMEGNNGGVGFDYRFAMGIPDYWIRLAKEFRDEDWPLGHLWYELNNRRKDEKTISYVESHDQALVGDQSLFFRLSGAAMYDHMHKDNPDLSIDRAMALHKMIRLITLSTAGHGYLNFMGNEFGHPEWVDFPRPENNWSYLYARRQWHLVDNPELKFQFLSRFDIAMIALAQHNHLLSAPVSALLHEHNEDKVIAYSRANLIFIFNFHPTQSYKAYGLRIPTGTWELLLDTDASDFGGHGRLVDKQQYTAVSKKPSSFTWQEFYLPSRTGIVLKEVK